MTFEEWWKTKYPFVYSMPGHLVDQRMEQKRIAKEAWDISELVHIKKMDSFNQARPLWDHAVHEHKFEPRYSEYKYWVNGDYQNTHKIYGHDICTICGKIIKK